MSKCTITAKQIKAAEREFLAFLKRFKGPFDRFLT